jgi:hypothetical protein
MFWGFNYEYVRNDSMMAGLVYGLLLYLQWGSEFTIHEGNPTKQDDFVQVLNSGFEHYPVVN